MEANYVYIFFFLNCVIFSKADMVAERTTQSAQNVTVPLGRNALLSCSSPDKASYQMAWIKYDSQTILSVQTKVITNDERIRVSHSNFQNWFLHISKVKLEDSGYYMCQINTQPTTHQLIYLDVVVPPDILDEHTNSDATIKEYESLYLKCKASGYPKPEIEWQREDGRKIRMRTPSGRKLKVSRVTGPTLNITRVNRGFMGAYLCMASNGVPPPVSKRINVYVNFAPTVKVRNQIMGASMSSTITVECEVEGWPLPMTSWTNEQKELIVSNKMKYETTTTMDHGQSYKMHVKLTIKKLEAGDFQMYTCTSTNILGKDAGNIKVYELKAASTSTFKSTTTINSTAFIISSSEKRNSVSTSKTVGYAGRNTSELFPSAKHTQNQGTDKKYITTSNTIQRTEDTRANNLEVKTEDYSNAKPSKGVQSESAINLNLSLLTMIATTMVLMMNTFNIQLINR